MRALVTGGGGFLGRALVEELLANGWEVTAASRRHYPELESLGARSVVMNVRDRAGVARAVDGHDTVFHAAARAGVWGPRYEYFLTNVKGTRHVLAACREHGVRRLVYTSSPSVCFDGRGHERASNDLPYARRFLCAYPRTKAIAEREVLAANGPELATCALRPHLIIGPRDPHLVPRLLARARAGRLMRVGDGTNEVSLTWVDNAALAHRLAAEQLAPDAPHAGRAYFIAQEEPVRLWPWIDALLESQGIAPVRRSISATGARCLGALLEAIWPLVPISGEPPMTRFVALQLASSHSYDMQPARRDFGYRERVSMAEADALLRSALAEGAPPLASRS